MTENLIIIGLLVCILAGVGYDLYRAKKRGQTCIGCPYAKKCGGGCGGSCAHSGEHKDK